MEKFLRSNNFARVLAIFIAIILWLFVMGDNITRTTPIIKVIQGVPLHYENLGPGLTVVDMPETVDVTLEGLPETFEGLIVGEMDVYVDLDEKETGHHQLRVRCAPPRALSLVSISPDVVDVVIETIESAAYPVYLEFTGTPAPGWVRQSHAISPTQVQVEAHRSLFEQIYRIVLRVDQTGMQETAQVKLAPMVLDRQGKVLPGVSLVPDQVEVSVELVREETPDS